jgi:hypothetical protein
MGLATSKPKIDAIVDKNYKDDNRLYKYFSGYNKKCKDAELVVNYLGDRNDHSCNSLSYY